MAEQVDEGTRDFGKLIFGEYGDDADAFLARVEASLLEPSSRASKYMARVRHKLHDGKELARTCILTHARVAFRFVPCTRSRATDAGRAAALALLARVLWLLCMPLEIRGECDRLTSSLAARACIIRAVHPAELHPPWLPTLQRALAGSGRPQAGRWRARHWWRRQ